MVGSDRDMEKKELLDIYTDYLISQNQYATATGLSAMLDGQVSHDQVGRLLRDSEYGSKALWTQIKSSVRTHEQDKGGVLILDDTISEKPYTDENSINCWHYCHSKGRNLKGINILSALISYDDVTLPVGYAITDKDIIYSDIKTKKQKRQSSVSKNEQFCSLLKQSVRNHIKFDYVLADSWFCSKNNLHFIHKDIKKHFIFAIKSNRLASLEKISKADKGNGQYLSVKSLDFQSGQCQGVYLKDIDFPVQLYKQSFTNEDGSTGTLYLVTNDLTLSADHLSALYHKRWKIEVFHKSIKQNASLSKSPTKTKRTQTNHLFASMLAFCKLELLKVKTAMNHFAIRHKLIVKANRTMFDELQKIKEIHACA